MKNIGCVLSLVLFSTSPFLGGCSDDEEPTRENERNPFDRPVTKLDCDDVELPAVVVIGSILSIDGTSLILKGTADLPSDLAIRQIRAGAVPATRDTFNFRTWTATIPESTWRFFPRSDTHFDVPVSVDEPCDTHDLTVQAPIPKGALDPEPADDGGA